MCCMTALFGGTPAAGQLGRLNSSAPQYFFYLFIFFTH